MKITAYNRDHNIDLSGGVGITSITYASTHTALGSNTPLVESGAGSPGSGPQAAPWDHVHPASGSSSFGSNSTRVAPTPAAGASSSNSRADHVHDGIGTITASSSNTLRRGTVNLRPGSGIALDLSSSDGGAELDTVTIQNIGGSGGGGGGTTITTKDEGSTLSSTVTTLDFVGSGVTASGAGATTTITIAGGGATNLSELGDVNVVSTPPADNDVLTYDSTSGKWIPAAVSGGGDTSGQFIVGWDNSPFALNTGTRQDVVAPFSGTITGWTILADVSGSASVDIGKCAYAGFDTFASIVAAAAPTLTGAIKATSTTLTGWTTGVTADDILRFTLSTASGVTRLLLVLTYSRP